MNLLNRGTFVKHAGSIMDVGRLLRNLNNNDMCVENPPSHIHWADRLHQIEKILLVEYFKRHNASSYTDNEKRFLVSHNAKDLIHWYDRWCCLWNINDPRPWPALM